MMEYSTQIRVRYADTDQMGYVYYGNYAMYYEVARTESLRNLGFTYKELEDGGVMMPVLENYSKYHAPARYDDLLTVKVFVKEKPRIKMIFDYEIYNESNTLINTGQTTLVFLKEENRKPCMMPEVLEKVLSPFFDDK